jgi:anaerobic selenocysteine-containing dehydrogenase
MVDELAVAVAVANELGVELPAHAPAVHRRLAAGVAGFAGSTWEHTAERAPLAPRDSSAAGTPPPTRPLPANAAPATVDLQLIAERSLFSGPAVARAPRLHFQRSREVLLNHEDAKRLEIAPGQEVVVRFEGGQVSGPARLSRSLAGGVVRVPWTQARRTGACTVEAVGAGA